MFHSACCGAAKVFMAAFRVGNKALAEEESTPSWFKLLNKALEDLCCEPYDLKDFLFNYDHPAVHDALRVSAGA